MTTLKFDNLYGCSHIQVDYTNHGRPHESVNEIAEITITNEDSTGKCPKVTSITSITVFDEDVKDLAAYLRKVADMLDSE